MMHPENLDFNQLPNQLPSHLSEDDLDEILMEIAAPEALAHAAACPLCAERLEAFRATLALFNQSSLAWSEAKSNTLDRDLTAHRSRAPLTFAAAWSYAAAGLVAAAILLTAGLHHHALAAGDADRAVISASVDSSDTLQRQIASDNAMLEAIDSELYRPVPSPAALSDDLDTTTTPRHDSSREVRN